MLQTYKLISAYSWGLLTSSSNTWDKISLENIEGNQIRKTYLYPWIALCILITLIFDSAYADKNFIQTGLLQSLIMAISLLGGYFLSNKICFWYLRKNHDNQFSFNACEKVVSFSFTAIFTIKIISAIFPEFLFLHLLNIYVAYLVWEACRAILKIDEDERGNIVFAFTICIVFSPIIIGQCIHLMLHYA